MGGWMTIRGMKGPAFRGLLAESPLVAGRLLQMLGFRIYDSEFLADHLRLERLP
jgi:hypothetical protein